MKLLPVSLAVFYRTSGESLEVWTQRREDDGIYHGLLEFPGGKIEANERPIEAAVREVLEEVGISINPSEGRLMGIYPNHLQGRVILLNVFLFPDQSSLKDRGEWLMIHSDQLSAPYEGKIPAPNHQIIDDLFRSLYSEA
jgi:8-oxo-dGTP diphosphatase